MTTGRSGLQLFLEIRGFRVPVDNIPFTIGNASTCEFQIEDDPAVSPHHAEIVPVDDDGFVIRDTDSETGVRVNGSPVAGDRRLEHGDSFTIGEAEFRVEFERVGKGPAPAATGAGAAAGDTGGAAGAPPPPGGRPLKPWMFFIGFSLLVLAAIVVSQLSGDEQKSASELVRDAKPSTMLVKAFRGDEPYGSGSAWVYDTDEGLVVTNSHVLIGSNRFGVSLEGESELRDADVYAVAECDDVAMLSVDDAEGLRTFPLAGEEDPPEQGDDVIALGFPNNASTADELQVTTGSLSALNINWDQPAQQNIDFAVYPDVHQVDAAINPGNSGGPLFEGEGQLIGMNSTRGDGDNQGFAISIDRLRGLLPGLAEGESTGWGGFTFTALRPEVLNRLADRFGLVGGWRDAALLVESVIPGSSAAEAGLEPLDGIYAIDGEAVTSRSEYCDAVGEASGEPVELSYWTADSLWAEQATRTVRFE